MLSDKRKDAKSPRKRKKTDVHRWYSDSQKMEAVKLWLVTGNLHATAATLDIPLPTLRVWRYSQWWADLVSDIQSEGRIQLSNKLQTIAEKSMAVVLDRLENGDFVLNQKTGEMIRKPVVIRDAARVANDMLDKAMKLNQKPVEEENKNIIDRLDKLKEEFARFAQLNKKVEVTDVIFVETDNAVHDQWKEGLQEGEALGEDQGDEQGRGSSGEDEEPASYGEGRESLQA